MSALINKVSCVALAVAGALWIAGCGASATTRGGPLDHRFEPRYIASVPIEDKQEVLAARDAVARAEMAHAAAVAEVEEARVDLEVGHNEVRQQELAVKSCKQRKDRAANCYDVPRIANSADDLAAAEAALAAARAHLAYLEHRLAYLEARRDYLREARHVAEAELELERARVAERNNIQPPGANVAVFERQRAERAAYARELADEAARKQREAESLRGQWERLQPEPEPAEPAPEPEEPAPEPAEPPEPAESTAAGEV